jgi:hypothetical protein
MATVLEVYTTEEHCSIFEFCVGKKTNAKDIHKNFFFPVYDGKCLSRKAVHNWRSPLKDV